LAFVTAPYRPGTVSPWRRRIILFVLLTAALALGLAIGVQGRPATQAPVPVLSGLERTGRVSLARDCGYSAPLPDNPGQSLWVFCDTPVYVRGTAANGNASWALTQFITGSTAAQGRAVAGSGPQRRFPGQLTEIGTPRLSADAVPGGAAPGGSAAPAAATPAPFLQRPAGLITPAGAPCGSGGESYAASWVSGVTRVPASHDLLIAFDNYCVLRGSGGIQPEGFGLAEYDPATGTLSDDVMVFSGISMVAGPAAELLGSPVISGGYLYLFGRVCTALARGGCAAGAVLEARVPANPLAWANPLSYQWQHGVPGSWTSDPAGATSIIGGATPAAVSVAYLPAAGRRFVLVEQTDIGGRFTVYGSAALAGPWTLIRSGRVPCGPGAGFLNFCRAIIVHPELSTPSQLVLSYFDPADGAGGHVMVAGFRW
jgi:hypothetical protein